MAETTIVTTLLFLVVTMFMLKSTAHRVGRPVMAESVTYRVGESTGRKRFP